LDCHVLPGRAAAWAFSNVIVLKTALWKAEALCRTAAVADADDAEGDSEGALEGALEGLDLTGLDLEGALEADERRGGDDRALTSAPVSMRSRSCSSGTEPRSSSACHQRSSREACSSEVASTEETIAEGRYSTLRK